MNLIKTKKKLFSEIFIEMLMSFAEVMKRDFFWDYF